jgi:ABC-2 type transport system permease protein
VTAFGHVAGAVLRRNLIHAFKNPALFVPALVFPMIFLVAFAGGLSRIGDVPGFDYPPGYTAFQFAFVFLQSAAFGGVFTGFAVAADWESGFARRLLLAAPQRTGIIAGYVAAAMVRFLVVGVVVTVAALVAGMEVDGGPVDLVGLLGLALLFNVSATLWGTGMSMRFKSLQAGPAMQIPVFLILFLAPVFVPLDLLTGWINTVASYNPATALLEAARGFIAGAPETVALAYLAGLALVAALAVFALTGLRRAERGE